MASDSCTDPHMTGYFALLNVQLNYRPGSNNFYCSEAQIWRQRTRRYQEAGMYLQCPPDVEKTSNSLVQRIEHGLLPNSRAWPKTESAETLFQVRHRQDFACYYQSITALQKLVEDSIRSPKIARTSLPPTLDWLGVAKFLLVPTRKMHVMLPPLPSQFSLPRPGRE